ncbi:hypothetical protein Gohar_025589 [Gossypium harknessii]|uniref:Uncharacterized protein n=1 Tax=Gossypium harknessii TaxID=34285 RepID=A0A7J9IE78_9ROSI|nr:hypothetical protein [Gossypium harknessii]
MGLPVDTVKSRFVTVRVCPVWADCVPKSSRICECEVS